MKVLDFQISDPNFQIRLPRLTNSGSAFFLNSSFNMYTIINQGSRLCRFCLNSDPNLINIFEDTSTTLALRASKILGTEIFQEDGVPDELCPPCLEQIDKFFKFHEMALQSYNIFKSKVVCVLKAIDDEGIEGKKTAEFYSLQNTQQNHQCAPTIEDRQIYEYSTDDEQKYPTVMKALKINQCLLCLAKLGSKTLLYSHIDKHLEGTQLDAYYKVRDKNIYCIVCKKSYKYRFSYIEHLRQHLNIAPFVCEHADCGHAFHSKSSLNFHKSKHRERRFACQCGAAYKRRSDLRAHELKHGEEGGAYQCERCGKNLKNTYTLRAHVRNHDKTPDHRCTHCSKRYYSRSELARHLVTHGGNKMFACSACRRAYYHKSALVRHQRQDCDALLTDRARPT